MPCRHWDHYQNIARWPSDNSSNNDLLLKISSVGQDALCNLVMSTQRGAKEAMCKTNFKYFQHFLSKSMDNVTKLQLNIVIVELLLSCTTFSEVFDTTRKSPS